MLADARAAQEVARRPRGPSVETDLVLLGESLGGAVAVDLAAADGHRRWCWRARSLPLPDAAAYHFPWLPVRLLMRTRLDSAAKIAAYHGPLLQSHGQPRPIIPLRPGAAAVRGRQRAEAIHYLHGPRSQRPRPPEYYDALAEFLRKDKG